MAKARPAQPSDAAEVVRLAAVMYESMGIDADRPGWRETSIQILKKRMGRDVQAFVVDHPSRPGALAASACCVLNNRLPSPARAEGLTGYVQWVATDPGCRRAGHARAVMETIVEWCKAGGVELVELHATRPGEPLYRSLGFGESEQVALRLDLTPRPAAGTASAEPR